LEEVFVRVVVEAKRVYGVLTYGVDAEGAICEDYDGVV
jgi:hypothetical protein